MKRALALLLVSALSLSLLSGCSAGPAAEQLSAEPISLTAQELAAHGPDVQDACDALSSFGLELLQNTEQSGESTLLSPLSVILALSMAAQRGGGRDAGSVPGGAGRRLSGGPQRRLSVSPV
ncbi:MAG: hypothetical protein ACLT3D_07720 [Lawsonibacter sp.]